MDYIPPALQGDVTKLWLDAGVSGINADPRKVRSGGTYMPPSSLCGGYTVSRRRTVVRDEFIGTLTADQIRIQFSFLDWPGIREHFELEGTRFETIASWQRSLLEHKRQVHRLAMLSETSKEILQEARELWTEQKDRILKIFMSQLNFIEQKGDWSLEQFEHYAKEHKRSGMGYRKLTWGSILRDESKLKEAYKQYYKVVSDLIHELQREKYYDGEHTIHPQWTYPALRSRPGDVVNMTIQDGTGDVLVNKHRDRAAGGVYGFSQLFWPIFKTDMKKMLSELLLAEVEGLTGLKLITPEVHGVQAYCDFLDEDPHSLTIFDTSLAERLEAQISDLPTAANLSIQGFEKRLGQKKFSGIAVTRTDQYITEPFLLLAAIKLGYISKASHYYFGGDNWAAPTGEEIPKELQEIFSVSQRWLGHDPIRQAISGFKLTVDSPGKGQNWTDRMVNFGLTQTKSGLVRLTRTLIGMNLLQDTFSLRDFLRKVASSSVDTINLHEGAPYHHLLDDPITAKTLIEEIPELELACDAVLATASQLEVPYKLVDDRKAPMEPTFHR